MKQVGFTASELAAAGYKAPKLKKAGFDAFSLRAAGFDARKLKATGFKVAALQTAGFTASELAAAPVEATPLKAAGFGGILLYKDDPPGRSIMDGYTLSYDYPSGVKLYFTQMVFHPKGLPGGGQFVHVYGQKGACDLMGDTSVYPLDGSAPPAALRPNTM